MEVQCQFQVILKVSRGMLHGILLSMQSYLLGIAYMIAVLHGVERPANMQSGDFRMPAQEAITNFQQAVELFNQGYWGQAVPLLESCAATIERVYGPQASELAECLQYLGDAYANEERNNQALAVYFKLFNLAERILGRSDPQIVSILWKMSILYERLDQPQDAYQMVNEALASARNCMRADDPLSQQVIDRHRYLSGVLRQIELEKSMGHAAAIVPPPDYYQTQQNIAQAGYVQPEYTQPQYAQVPPQNEAPEGYTTPTPQASALQALARQSLAELSQFSATDAPRVPFSNSVHAEGLEDSGHFGQQTKALDPSVIERNRQAPPGRPLTSSSVLGHRPEPVVEDSGIYTIEEIEALTGRRAAVVTHGDGKTHRLTTSDNIRIFFGRFGMKVILPAVGGLIFMGLLIVAFWPMISPKQTGKNVSVQANGAGKGTKTGGALSAGTALEIFESGDSKEQIRLLDGENAIVANETSAIEVPYEKIGNNWGDYFRAASHSLTEKQIWLSRTKSGLIAENGELFYGIKEQERRVIEKMRYLAGFAQGVFMRAGEYPKFVPLGCGSEFSYINPFNGREQAITIRRVSTAVNDAMDVKTALQSGIMVANEIANEPGYISCYAATLGEGDYDRQRAVRFFIRGLDRDGKFIGTSKPGQAYVVQADNKYLEFKPLFRDMDDYKTLQAEDKQLLNAQQAQLTQPGKQAQKTAVKTQKIKKGKNMPLPKSLKVAKGGYRAEDELLSRLKLEKPSKPTRIWLLQESGFPLAILHFLIAIVLAIAAAVCFARSQMTIVDTKNKTEMQGSNIALILGTVFFALFFATMVLQFSIFR